MTHYINVNTIFESSNIYFEKDTIQNKIISTSDLDQAYFGILNLKSVAFETSNLNKEYDFIFTIDRSGSMSDICCDGRTKQQHICHTLKNMVWFFHNNPSIKAKITIYAFDNNINKVIDRMSVTSKNIDHFIKKIDLIQPCGSTNIEMALNTVNNFIKEIEFVSPHSEINHVFMTDGDATIGQTHPLTLKSLVNDKYTNIFVGFGIDHNNNVLDELSSNKNSHYYFIDKLENSGLVYGEILHNLLYKLLKETEITIENGLIYNFYTNSWVNQLFVGDIISESTKIYHIISNNPDTCVIHISAIPFYFNNIEGNIHFYDYKINNITYQDNLTKYVFRQKTFELLYQIKHKSKFDDKDNNTYNQNLSEDKLSCLSPKFNTTNIHNNFLFNNFELKLNLNLNFKNNEINNVNDSLKNKMKTLIEEMKKYMKDNDLENDPFMKNLCDDIYISYKTFDTRYSGMYTCARLTSQGTQRFYNVSHLENIHETNFHNDNDDNDNIFNSHNLEQLNHSPYSTPSAQQIMRFVSDNSENNNSPISINSNTVYTDEDDIMYISSSDEDN